MPIDTSDQQITLPVGADIADGPVAFSNAVTDIEPRLVLRYVDAADRTARHPVSVENQVSGLANENRIETYDGANWISLYPRSLFAYVRKTSDETISNSAALQNDDELFLALPTAGTFGFSITVFYDVSTTADFNIGLTIPAGATGIYGVMGMVAGGGLGGGDVNTTSTTTFGNSFILGGAGVNNLLRCTLEGEVTMGGTAGNLQLRWCQNVAEVSNTTVRARSRMLAWRTA